MEQTADIIISIEPIAVRPEAAAAMLGIGESTLRDLLRRGEIVGKKLSNTPRASVLIPIAELHRFVASLPTTGRSSTSPPAGSEGAGVSHPAPAPDGGAT